MFSLFSQFTNMFSYKQKKNIYDLNVLIKQILCSTFNLLFKQQQTTNTLLIDLRQQYDTHP